MNTIARHRAADNPLDCGIYGRISQDEDNDADGVTRQVEDGRQLIAGRPGWAMTTCAGSKGWRPGEFIDNDISATKGKPRPEYRRLMAEVAAGRIKVIVVYTTSRLLRTRRDRLEALETLAAAGARVCPVRGPELDFSSAAGRMVAGILGEVDAHETEQMAERISRAARQSAERGEYLGPTPFGYRKIYEPARNGGARFTGMLEIIPEQAAEIRAAAIRIIAGDSLYSIARDWNASAVMSRPRGGRRTGESVRDTMLRPYLIGVRATYPPGVMRKGGAPVAWHQGKWPPILTAEQRELMLAAMNSRRRPPPVTRRSHLLSGFIRCGQCGARMHAGRPGRGDRWKYVCPVEGCRKSCRDAEAAEAWVQVNVFHWFEPNGALDKALADADQEDEETVTLAGAIAHDRGLLARLASKIADELLTAAEAREQRAQITERIRARERELDRRRHNGTVDRIRERGAEFRARWQREGPGWQHMVLAAVLDRVIVNPAKRGNNGFDPAAVKVIPGGLLGEAGTVLTEPPATMRILGRGPLRQRIREWLAEHPGAEFTLDELTRALGLPGKDDNRSARGAVTGMCQDGELVKAGLVKAGPRPGGRPGGGRPAITYRAA